MSYSVNVCYVCRKNLTLSEDTNPYRSQKCSTCTYLHNIGVYTIEQYNEYLKDGRGPRTRNIFNY